MAKRSVLKWLKINTWTVNFSNEVIKNDSTVPSIMGGPRFSSRLTYTNNAVKGDMTDLLISYLSSSHLSSKKYKIIT